MKIIQKPESTKSLAMDPLTGVCLRLVEWWHGERGRAGVVCLKLKSWTFILKMKGRLWRVLQDWQPPIWTWQELVSSSRSQKVGPGHHRGEQGVGINKTAASQLIEFYDNVDVARIEKGKSRWFHPVKNVCASRVRSVTSLENFSCKMILLELTLNYYSFHS